ncbi:MAG: SCP2 sterol-binding domain-containing protein [Candidatus Helarchaeota archaeon]|nr:SCP2 sterol-binding domain-containing protein [Candidatus Helarchaeota archaeon]
MSIKQRLEKSAKILGRFSGIIEVFGAFLSNANVYFNVTDDTSYTLEIRDLATTVSEGKIQPVTLEIIGTKENFLEFLQGNITFPKAWVNGKLKVKGVRNNLLSAFTMGMVIGGV